MWRNMVPRAKYGSLLYMSRGTRITTEKGDNSQTQMLT